MIESAWAMVATYKTNEAMSTYNPLQTVKSLCPHDGKLSFNVAFVT
jgi:hypothetical protein